MYIYLPWQYLSYAEAHPVLRKAKNHYSSNFNHLPPRGNEGEIVREL